MKKKIYFEMLAFIICIGMLAGCSKESPKTDVSGGNPVSSKTETEDQQPDYSLIEEEELEDTDVSEQNDTLYAGLEEAVIKGWDASKKIKQILLNGINENILTTEDELYYKTGGSWVKNDKVIGLGDKLQFISPLLLFNGDGFYLFPNPDPAYPALRKYETSVSFKISKVGKSLGNDLLFVLDTDNNFRIICRNSDDIYDELKLPPMLQDSSVIDFAKNDCYLTEDGDLKKLPTFDRIESDGTIIEFADYSLFKLLVSTDVKQVFDTKATGFDLFILHNNNDLNFYNGQTERELLTVSSDIGTIKEVVGNDMGFIVVTDLGYYTGRRGGELMPSAELNDIKDKIVGIAYFEYDLVVILDDGKVYKFD